jgi:hypothetical protein
LTKRIVLLQDNFNKIILFPFYLSFPGGEAGPEGHRGPGRKVDKLDSGRNGFFREVGIQFLDVFVETSSDSPDSSLRTGI